MPEIKWSKTTLTGGGATALDSMDGADLTDGDYAFVCVSGVLYVYRLDATSGATENSPDVIAPDTNAGNKRWILESAFNLIKSGSVVNAATGSPTYIDFTSIPSWVKRITIMLSAISTNGTSDVIVQLGDSGGIETSGYSSIAAFIGGAAGAEASSAGFLADAGNWDASYALSGIITLDLIDPATNKWVCSGTLGVATYSFVTSGVKALSAALDRIRLTTAGGSDVFDGGYINILYE